MSKGKDIKVGDGSRRTFYYVMGSWYNVDTPDSKEKNDESEDDDDFRDEDGYSSDRAHNRHSGAWWRGLLRGETMKGGNIGEKTDCSDDSGDSEEEK